VAHRVVVVVQAAQVLVDAGIDDVDGVAQR
jgi:hypothetical protein